MGYVGWSISGRIQQEPQEPWSEARYGKGFVLSPVDLLCGGIAQRFGGRQAGREISPGRSGAMDRLSERSEQHQRSGRALCGTGFRAYGYKGYELQFESYGSEVCGAEGQTLRAASDFQAFMRDLRISSITA